MKSLIISICLLCIAVPGCHSSDPTEPPPFPAPATINGTWTFTQAGAFSMDLTLSQFRSHVTGDGVLTQLSNGSTNEADIGGSCSYPDVSLTIAIPGYESIILTGKILNQTTITGVLNQSGFSDFPITLTKVQ